jgi:hypothetical protein
MWHNYKQKEETKCMHTNVAQRRIRWSKVEGERQSEVAMGEGELQSYYLPT